MILVTVGTQLPFDRFVKIVDRIAANLPEEVFAQTGRGEYQPVNMRFARVVGPIAFERLVRDCSRIVSHAGIGTIVMAQKHQKPLILFPRLGVLDEHRNDHQVATVRALSGRPGIYCAADEAELTALLGQDLQSPPPADHLPERERLRNAVATFIGDQRRLFDAKGSRLV